MHGSGGFQALLHTYSLTAAVLPGRIVFFLESVCMEGVPPALQTVGPLENWRGRQTTPKKTVRSSGAPILRTERSDAGCTHPSVLRRRLRIYRLNRLETNACWLCAQTQAARTHRSLDADFESTALTAWQRMREG